MFQRLGRRLFAPVQKRRYCAGASDFQQLEVQTKIQGVLQAGEGVWVEPRIRDVEGNGAQLWQFVNDAWKPLLGMQSVCPLAHYIVMLESAVDRPASCDEFEYFGGGKVQEDGSKHVAGDVAEQHFRPPQVLPLPNDGSSVMDAVNGRAVQQVLESLALRLRSKRVIAFCIAFESISLAILNNES